MCSITFFNLFIIMEIISARKISKFKLYCLFICLYEFINKKTQNTNSRIPPHLRERSRQLGVRPAPSISLRAPTSIAKSRKAFNSLATQKILDYEKRKQELIEFTEKVSKRKIKEGLKRYKMTNKETMFDFLTRLDRYPGIEAVIPIDGIRSGYYTGLRLLIDGDFPKTSQPNNAPVENTRKRIM